MFRATLAGLLILLSIPMYSADQTLANGYFFLGVKDGIIGSLRFDPSGKAKYGDNLITAMYLGEKSDTANLAKVETSPTNLTFRGLTVRNPYTIEYFDSSRPVRFEPTSVFGVKFTVKSGKVTSAGGKFPTWGQTTSGITLSVYRVPEGDLTRKELITSRKFANIKDNGVLSLEFDPQPAGVFYLEASDPKGESVGWWGTVKDVEPSITAYIDGKEQKDLDFSLRYSGFEEIVGDWTIMLDGPKMTSDFTCDPKLAASLKTTLTTPWVKSGYDVSKFPFSRFYSDTGRHVLPQQFKRRPSNYIQCGEWVYAMGKKAYDLRFNLVPGQKLTWAFTDNEAQWNLNGAAMNLDVLPHSDKLPNYYPAFYSSDKKYAEIATQFYYSHALNFGVGTNADWKEWQGLILDWTDNPQTFEQRGHFTGVRMRSDGYVYTWGADEGWPFPYKDEDKDGKNDFDTRHFTTNPCFILGAYRYFCWTRDMDFINEMMPKLRKAMEFELNDMHGKDGIIVIDAKGHEGRDGGIGSNYWDILPFGYKDAFSNSYYYAALQAMGELEGFCTAMNLDLPGESHPPAYYTLLRSKVRREYNRTFWDDKAGRYVGCVDADGVKHDYGFTFVNMDAMAYGLADKDQVERIYRWMEQGITSSGKADTYTKWVFAPRANTIHNPGKAEVTSEQSTVTSVPDTRNPKPGTVTEESPSSNQQIPNPDTASPRLPVSASLAPSPPVAPSPQSPWWFSGWRGTPYGDQCQDGGAILYTSYADLVTRARFLGADNAYKRFTEILDRYNLPDRLMGGNPLFTGETSQGGGNGAGSVGVEGEFPESGLVPASFLYAFLGIDADIHGLKILPNLPTGMKYAGVRNLSYGGVKYDIKVTRDTVEIRPLDVANPTVIKHKFATREPFVLSAGVSL